MENLKLRLNLRIDVELNLLEAITNFSIDEDKLVEAIEANDEQEINNIVSNLKGNVAQLFDFQRFMEIEPVDTHKDSIDILYNGQPIKSNN